MYKIYNLFSRNYKTIYNKRSFLAIKTILRISNKNVLIENFNFYFTI